MAANIPSHNEELRKDIHQKEFQSFHQFDMQFHPPQIQPKQTEKLQIFQ